MSLPIHKCLSPEAQSAIRLQFQTRLRLTLAEVLSARAGKTNSQVLQDTMRGIRMENPAGNPITPAASIGGGSSNGSNGGQRFARQEPVYTVECSPQLYQVLIALF